ncbi:putative helicase MOV-10 [Mya arenaria]|uniref:putative helicase MOV-10 n=1 Tax=Mya arenaria TaxID=6604 RepID=UPI0022E78BCF|nr:putative helicase MOV-10 [Mya arenaria]XP_052789742.1 putative helicase MOV-10 [Mya arenaria]XP_052789743.1 putative helicase MOV-10 [Mya arenaria]
MPSGRRRPPFNSVVKESEAFLSYLRNKECPDIFKRNELRALYDGEFVQSRRSASRDYVKVAFRAILLDLKHTKRIHELGDYFSFAKDIQMLYEKLSESSEFQSQLEEWKKIAEEKPYFCETCGIDCVSEKNLESHINGNRHRFHKLHIEIYQKRDSMIAIPKGVTLNSDPAVVYPGLMEKQCRPGANLTMTLTIANNSADHIIVFQRFVVLWDTGMFKVYELGADKNRKPVKQNRHLQFGQKVELVIVCSAPLDFGNHFVPLSLYFVKKDKQTNVVISEEEEGASQQDFVLRFLSLHVIGDLHETLKPVEPFKFPEAMPDRPVEKTEPGEPLPEKKNELTGKLEHFPIPRYLPVQVQYGMTGTNITGNKQIVNAKLREMLSGELTADTYRTRFSTLLWVEQIQMKKDITRYDLVHVTLDRHPTTGRLILQVPGLLERRPSVLRGDRVYIYSDDNRAIRYEGIVHLVELEQVHLGVSPKLRNSWMRGQRFDIRFDFSPLNLWVMHRAVKYSAGVAPILFPTQSTMSPGQESITLKPWFDRNLNDEQQTAVKNIVQGTSRPAPYIIFGPPGTGKTVTVTEAIRQVYHGQADSQILVCCPENTASDHVFKKLISTSLPGPVKKADIFRLYAVSRAYASVPNVIRESKQFNYDPVDKDFFYPTKAEVKGYRVLVVTLMTASRLVTASFPKNHYTHIFIDEGAHAQEPECVVPISGLLDPSNRAECGQLVIAGDPKQLGPILRSPIAIHAGLDVSFMERMMRDIGEYSRGEDGVYDNRYITKLVRNYRSHDDIIYVPRALFYDGELTAAGDEMILNSMLNKDFLPNKKFPLIFHSVFGTDEREKDSPSWFNRDEVSQVDKYLQELLRDQKGGIKLKPSDIGIISPYRKQVAKIREMIKLKGHSSNRGDIMVGSVEEFQGQEFKVIIISTVRSCKDSAYTDQDLEYRLGFLRNPKRFNVAVTRARALLIVIGNPVTLEQDKIWKRFIEYCDVNGGFKGQRGKLTSNHGLQADTEEKRGENRTIYIRDELSAIQQMEDPEWNRRE